MNPIRFTVSGTPQTAGSKKGFVLPGKDGRKPRAIITEDFGSRENALRKKTWRGDIRDAFYAAYDGEPLRGAIRLSVSFCFARPQSHYKTGKFGGVKDSAPKSWHTQTPDATKILRALEDALNGVAWMDDKQIAQQQVDKTWSVLSCAHVTIEEI